MQISLFDIIAGIINFFVLLFILNKLFYKPVKKVMEERQQNIEENVRSAERRNSEASELISEYEKKLSEIETEKTEKMIETKKEAEEYRRNLIGKYEEEAKLKKEAFLSEVSEDKDAMASEIRALMAKGTVDIARSLFEQFKREDLDEHLFDALLEKLKTFSMENQEIGDLKNDGRFVLLGAGRVNEERKKELQHVLEENSFAIEALDYKEDTSLVAGFELHMQGYTIHSSISHYLEKKEEQMVLYFEEAVRDRGEDYDTQK